MGRWSRELAREFVSWLAILDDGHWLDIGCGTGALTSAICAQADPRSVVACDPVESFIEYARAHLQDDRVSFRVAGADDFPIPAGGYDCIASLLALNFFPDPASAVARMRSATRAGGTVTACVWDYAGGMEFLRQFWDAAVRIKPAASQYDEGVRFPICRPGPLADLFRVAGLAEVRCEAIDIDTSFDSFGDYWQPLLGATGPAPSFVASLGDAERDSLRAELESALPIAAGGEIALRARAWAIRGLAR